MTRSLSQMVAACLMAIAVTSLGFAQPGNSSKQESPGAQREHTLQIPPGNPILELNVQMPEEMRAGESYRYALTVSNVTDDVMVHNIVLMQQTPSSVEIQDSKGEKMGNKAQAESKDKNKQKQSKKGDQSSSFWDWEWEQQQQTAKQSMQQGRWTIEKLKPGESQSISLTAVSDKVGTFDTCLAVKSYVPALCLTTKYVKPDVELTKQAPERANLCEEIEYTYLVKNTGSGDAQNFTISDPLPKGIVTIDGKNTLQFKVDGLKAGDARKFVATLRANQTGNLGSRAIAKLKGGAEAQSNKPMTEINQADLAVDIQGPDTEYINRPLNYTVTVKNNGNAPAPGTQLTVMFPDAANVARVGDVRSASGDDAQASATPRPAGEPTAAQPRATDEEGTLLIFAPAPEGNQSKQSSKQQMANRSWDLGTLQPGEVRKVSLTLRSDEAGMIPQKAVAAYICDIDRDQDKLQTVATHETELIALPALLLSVVDNADPIKSGNDVTYSIVVVNQGDAPDHDVNISVQLPQSLQFVEADGPTEAKQSGKTVNFGEVKKVAPGERLSYTLTAKATGTGNILLKTSLSSKGLGNRPAQAEEPTQLFQD